MIQKKISQAKLRVIENALSGDATALAVILKNLQDDVRSDTAKHLLRSLCIDHVEKWVRELPLLEGEKEYFITVVDTIRTGENGNDSDYADTLGLLVQCSRSGLTDNKNTGYTAGATLRTALIALGTILKS